MALLKTAQQQPKFVLASASPRRRDLLKQIGIPFTVCPSQINENEINTAGLPPYSQVEKLALAKAENVSKLGPGPRSIVIGADTVVVLNNEVIGKPVDAADARRILTKLSGQRHQVYTGIALVEPDGRRQVAHACTEVRIGPLSTHWIDAYTATGEPMDKAGAYAVQGLGSAMVEQINGCYFNVVGLPLSTLASMLKNWDIELFHIWRMVP